MAAQPWSSPRLFVCFACLAFAYPLWLRAFFVCCGFVSRFCLLLLFVLIRRVFATLRCVVASGDFCVTRIQWWDSRGEATNGSLYCLFVLRSVDLSDVLTAFPRWCHVGHVVPWAGASRWGCGYRKFVSVLSGVLIALALVNSRLWSRCELACQGVHVANALVRCCHLTEWYCQIWVLTGLPFRGNCLTTSCPKLVQGLLWPY